MFHADRVIFRLPCGQGQLSRIWKVQCDWLSMGKGMLSSVEQAFVGRNEKRAPLKTHAWEASPIKEVLALIYHDVIDDVLFLPP